MSDSCTTCGFYSEEQFDGHNCLTVLKEKVQLLEKSKRVLEWLESNSVEISSNIDELGVEQCMLVVRNKSGSSSYLANNVSEAVLDAIGEEMDESGEGAWA